jgi:hypothetical protein
MKLGDVTLKYVDRFVDRQGRERLYFRPPGGPRKRLPPRLDDGSLPSDFLLHYNLLMAGEGGGLPSLAPVRKQRLGTIYFAGFGRYVKIGFTRGDPAHRIKTLQTGAPAPITIYATIENATPAMEKQLHRRFRRLRLLNEWFDLTPAFQKWLLALRAEQAGNAVDPNPCNPSPKGLGNRPKSHEKSTAWPQGWRPRQGSNLRPAA